MTQYKYRKRFTYEGKVYSIVGNTLEEVYTKKAEKLHALQEQTRLYTGAMTVAQWTDKALSVYKGNVKDISNIEKRINKHILSQIGSFQIKKVTPIQCQEIMNAQAGMSYSHINKIFTELKFIFSTAVENDIIKKSPAAKIVKPSVKKGHRRSLTDNERKHLLKLFAESDDYLLFELMYYCGCRPGEAIEAEGRDIVDGMLHIRGTKTEGADRYVPIPEPLLKKIRHIVGFLPLAPNKEGRKHTESSYDRAVNSLKRALNISMGTRVYRNALVPPYALADDFVPYYLRHTYCTDLAKSGVDIRTAQKLMGHASIIMTADIYTHVDTGDLKKAAEKIAAYHDAI